MTLGCGTSVPSLWGIPADIRRGGIEPSLNDPFPEADVAVIIMNRFVIKPVLAPPTKHNQLVGDVPVPSNTPDHQHNWQKDQGLPSGINTGFSMTALTMCRWSDLTTCLPGTHHITVRADDTPPTQSGAVLCHLCDQQFEFGARG